MYSNDQHYSLLPKQEADEEIFSSISEQDSVLAGQRARPQSRCLKWLRICAVQIAVLAVYTATLVSVGQWFVPGLLTSPKTFDVMYSPMKDAYKYVVREVGYNFEDVNAFKGRPIEEVDKAWDQLLNGPHELLISSSDLDRMNTSSITVNLPEPNNHMVTPIAFHMLHCLYNIQKYVHTDFYGEDPTGPNWIRVHTDHCVDNLRQFVQCHAGTGMSTYKWLDKRNTPWPVLNTKEVCVDWDYFDGWVRQHSIPLEMIKTLKSDTHESLLVHPKFGPITPEDYQKKVDVDEEGHITLHQDHSAHGGR